MINKNTFESSHNPPKKEKKVPQAKSASPKIHRDNFSCLALKL